MRISNQRIKPGWLKPNYCDEVGVLLHINKSAQQTAYVHFKSNITKIEIEVKLFWLECDIFLHLFSFEFQFNLNFQRLHFNTAVHHKVFASHYYFSDIFPPYYFLRVNKIRHKLVLPVPTCPAAHTLTHHLLMTPHQPRAACQPSHSVSERKMLDSLRSSRVDVAVIAE